MIHDVNFIYPLTLFKPLFGLKQWHPKQTLTRNHPTLILETISFLVSAPLAVCPPQLALAKDPERCLVTVGLQYDSGLKRLDHLETVMAYSSSKSSSNGSFVKLEWGRLLLPDRKVKESCQILTIIYQTLIL